MQLFQLPVPEHVLDYTPFPGLPNSQVISRVPTPHLLITKFAERGRTVGM